MAADDLAALIGRIPVCCSTTPDLRCCCGRTDCAYLKHNCVALDDLEKEVKTAAQLGQALLLRHEQYMYDAERDRLDMSAKIDSLESDKKALEDQNAKAIEENRTLLDQLEGLNGTVADSETHIKSLEATLLSTRQELRRLEGLASRTYDLETQLASLEQEQEALQKTIITTQEDERTAIQRWKKAERGLNDLQEQLERIDREATEERERHVEVLGRMERQRVVERELDTAAGRLKSAASTTTGPGKNGSSVVSHFVKDILQDNANLQLGIVELREMLINSNDEVQALREQLMMHQPVAEDKELSSEPATLRSELAPQQVEPQIVSQAVHIHHHYHAPKKEDSRRPKKKRTSINAVLFTPPKSNVSSRTPRGPDTSSTILSHTAVSIPPNTPQRWSMQSMQSGQSDFAPSSVPSSPQSTYRHSALFDRGYDIDSSRPTSPVSSIDPMSPQFAPHHHRKRGSEVSTRSFVATTSFQPHNIIPEEEDDGDVEELPDLEMPSVPPSEGDVTVSETSHDSEFPTTEEHEDWTSQFQPSLRRTTSHESILSISGLDIHTLKSRPSQMTITGGLLRPRTRLGAATTIVSMDTTTVRPTLSRYGHDSTTHLRANIHPINSDARSISSSGSNEGVGSKLGDWVFGRWGATPKPSSISKSRVASAPVDPLRSFMGRPPGVNQRGPIPGFKKAEKAPSKVIPDAVNHDALTEVLMEGLLH